MALRNNLNENLLDDAAKQQGGSRNLVVRVEQDPEKNLQALFDISMKRNPMESVPLRERKLPKSFFTPPCQQPSGIAGSKSPTAQHSRENSTDSAFSTGSQSTTKNVVVNNNNDQQQNVAQSENMRKVLISHSRAHSSPAQLQQFEPQRQPQQQQQPQNMHPQPQKKFINAANVDKPMHSKQRSYDITRLNNNDMGELPMGWEQAKTPDGQIYYINHNSKTTQWEHPRQQQQRPQSQLTPQLENLRLDSANSSHENILTALPEGWESAKTENGETYFINHVDRTTSWIDPRTQFLPRQTESWKVNIMGLDKEREQMKLRQAELQEFGILAGIPNIDPFLSDHARQESGDSGLSLSSSNFVSPQDFILDDSMDCGYADHDNNLDLTLDSPDNLVSSLQINDSLCNEMLNVHNLINSSTIKNESNSDWYKSFQS